MGRKKRKTLIPVELPLAERILAACVSGDFQVVFKEIGRYDLHHHFEEGYQVLHFASAHGNLEAMRRLIDECKCDPKCIDALKFTPLHYACSYGHLDVVRYLTVEQKCDPHMLSKEEYSPLHCAIDSHCCSPILVDKCRDNSLSHFEIVKFLVEKCPYNAERHGKIYLLLHMVHMACKYGTLSDVKFFVEKKQLDPSQQHEIPANSISIVRREDISALHVACEIGNLEIVKYLVEERSCNPNLEDIDGLTPLLYACLNHNNKVAEFLVKECRCDPTQEVFTSTPQYYECDDDCDDDSEFDFCGGYHDDLYGDSYGGYVHFGFDNPIEYACTSNQVNLMKALTSVDVNCQDENGNSPLHHACRSYNYSNDFSIIKYLVEEKCDQNIQNADGELALHISCEKRCLEMVKLVSDCDVYVQTKGGDTPLYIACKNEDIKIMKFLALTKNCSPAQYPHLYDNLYIHPACVVGDLDLIKVLATTENVNCRDPINGNTPLHVACLEAKLEIVHFLVREMHCDLTIPNCSSELALHTACYTCLIHKDKLSWSSVMLEIVRLVSSCDTNVNDYDLDTPLHIACRFEVGWFDIFKHLIEVRCCDINVQNGYGEVPLHIACAIGSLQMVRMVSSCNPNCKTQYSETPLLYACRHGRLEIARYLLENTECDPTIANCDNELPIHCACRHSLDLVKLLVDFADVNLECRTSEHGLAPMHIASYFGKVEIVRYLYERGCDPTIHDKHAFTPLHYAYKKSHCHWWRDYNNNHFGNTSAFCAKFTDPTNTERAQVVKYLVENCRCDPTGITDEYYYHDLQNYDNVLDFSIIGSVILNHNFELAKALTCGSIDINFSDSKGDTLLHLACRSPYNRSFESQLAVTRFLTEEQHCNRNIPNKNGLLPIHLACEIGCLEMVKLVIPNDVNAVTVDGITPLYIASKSGHANIVEFLINSQCDPTIASRNGSLPVHFTCEQASFQLTELVSKCDLNVKGTDGNTPLNILFHSKKFYELSEDQKLKFIQYLIAKGCDPSIPNNNNDTPVHVTCRRGNFRFFQILVTSRSVNCKGRNGNTPLHVSTRCIYPQIVQFLIDVHKCNINLQNDDGDTALHLACKNGAYRMACILQYLIESKCDLSVPNFRGELPLHVACRYKISVKALKVLLRNNQGNVNCQTMSGDTPLHIACQEVSIKVADYLIEVVGCRTDIQNSKGDLPLHVASCRQSLHLLKLVSKNCNLNCQNGIGDTALHIVCRGGEFKLAKHLLRMKCNANLQNDKGELPLHLACQQSLELTILISKQTDNPNIKSRCGDTPLHIACRKGIENLPVVEYLISNDYCNASLRNNKGQLPLHIACWHGSVEMVKPVSNYNLNCPVTADDSINLKANDPPLHISVGDTPLHIACRIQNLQLVRFLISSGFHLENAYEELPQQVVISGLHKLQLVTLVNSCDINIHTKSGDTALHLACSQLPNIAERNYIYKTRLTTSLILQLAKDKLCSANIPNINGELPLHILCSKWCDEYLLNVVSSKCDVNAPTITGNTPLHTACKSRNRKVVTYLVKEKNCDVGRSNKDRELPLHIACQMFTSDTVKLLTEGDIDINAQTASGDTPLHIACKFQTLCKHEYYAIKHFIEVKHCDLTRQNHLGELPLHIACCHQNLNVVKLLCGDGVDVNQQTIAGDTPLHKACENSEYDGEQIVKYLIENKVCNTTVCNKKKELPLHVACFRLDIKRIQMLGKSCSTPNRKTVSGNTPLHEVCNRTEYRYVSTFHNSKIMEILQFLIEEIGCNTDCRNDAGKTPLHYLCERNSLEGVKYLVSKHHVDVSVTDNKEQTPIMLTTNADIIKILLDHGAKAMPLYELHEIFFRNHASDSQPPPTPVKVLVVGNASNGKTTLIDSLKHEREKFQSLEPPQHTAGIIPNDFESEIYGFVTLYDFAGQHEYYASHETMIHAIVRHSPPVILLLVNLNKHSEEIARELCYWLAFIENQSTSVSDMAHLIVVGSHADVLESVGDKPNEKISSIVDSLRQRVERSCMVLAAALSMDCRQPHSEEISILRQYLKKSCDSLRIKGTMNFTCHCFYVSLIDQFRQFSAVTVDQIRNATVVKSRQVSEYSYHSWNESSESTLKKSFFPVDIVEVVQKLDDLSGRGHITFLKNPKRLHMSWVILDKEAILADVNGTVFAPQGFQQHQNLASSTGVVPFSKIKAHFSKYDPKLLVAFLSHLEFCFEIQDKEVLELLNNEIIRFSPSSEQYFFFPSLVSIETPNSVWKKNDRFSYQCGWMLQTVNDHFFTPRFLQVLILRLAFSCTQTQSKPAESHDLPVIRRVCSVWKRGISWTNRDGVETVVEVLEQSQAVVVMMRCFNMLKSLVQCLHLRSSIIQKVLKATAEFCSVSTLESFIHPDDLQYPPKSGSETVLFHIPGVAQTIVDMNPCVHDDSDVGEIISMEELLYFEPYSDIGRQLLEKLFDKENEDVKVSDYFLNEISQSIVANTEPRYLKQKKELFLKLFKLNPDVLHEQVMSIPESQSFQFKKMFQIWCSRSYVTYGHLKKTLDKYSIFCGRNLLEFCTTNCAQEKVIDDNPSRHLQDDPPSLSNKYERMYQYCDRIIEQLADAQCSGVLADKLRRSKLITKHVYELGTNVGPGVVESTRIRHMINAVLSKVQYNPHNYHTFIDILNEIEGLEDTLQDINSLSVPLKCIGAPPVGTSQAAVQLLGDGDLFEITTYLAKLDNETVYILGLALGLNQGKVKRMRESETFVDDVIAAWLRREDYVEIKGMPTWKTLVKALRHPRIKQNGLANDIGKDKGL